MRSLLIIAVFLTSAHAKECPAIAQDYLEHFELPKESVLLAIPANISGKNSDKLLCAQDSCGSRGCECALYVEVDGCPKRVLEFYGQHKVLGEQQEGMPNIVIKRRGDALVGTSSKTYIWNKEGRRYVEAK